MSQPKSFTTSNPADAKLADYKCLKVSHVEYVKLLASGHPGGTVSFAQAGVHVVFGASDMSQIRDAYADADADALVAGKPFTVIPA
ncbi:hypothetical protein [Cupriavidus nantongensis]|uniref:hypothetical protein n=1 Tax=Cupriavidus nantongensis TaxID=1796606 RepID=UPI0012372DCD|nr:hypothetical protein [Cupriavidus nantongensis]